MSVGVRAIAVAIGLLLSLGSARAQATESESIARAAWLAGRWIGEGLGGQIEETWAPPAGGQMVGHFRLVRAGAPVFYEIALIDEADGALRLRVKHFNPDFVGWEEPGEWVSFPFEGAAADELRFRGLRLRRIGADEAEITIRIRYSDTDVRDEVLRLRRAPL